MLDNEPQRETAEPLSPVNMDKMMNVIEIKMWVAFASLLIILASAIVWGFFGTMQMRLDVSGALVKSGKIVNVFASEDCILLDFTLSSGAYVEKDWVAARTEQPELVNEINLMIAEGFPKAEIEAKRVELIGKSRILTPESGRVVNTYAHTGDYVKNGTKLATISKEAPNGKAMECLLFIPADKIKSVRKGLSVYVYPAKISRQNYGSMTGVVSFISEYPVTEQYMFDTLGSEELANEFLKKGACYEVCVNLTTSEETVTGYEWTTSAGPPKKFGDITLCDAIVVIEELRPVDVFFFDS